MEIPAPPALHLRGISKRFGKVVANHGITVEVNPGEIHCLLGENGAGKSTLMKIAFGLYQPDEGEILMRGQPVRFHGPLDAIAAGIGMVHQHFQLISDFTVAENIVLGNEPTRRGFIDVGAAVDRIRELSDRYGLRVDPRARIGDLSVGAQQRVELLRALYRDASVLVLDEPTAVLTPQEVDDLFVMIRSIVAEGKAVVFITHKLREVLAVADRITVLRAGTVVGTADPKTATAADLAELMVGRSVVLRVPKSPADPGEVRLEVNNLSVADDSGVPALTDVTFEVRAGEILGFAGIEGNGQRELAEALTGLRAVSGEITIGGKAVRRARPRDFADLGVAHIPEDRLKFGAVAPFSVSDNLTLNRFRMPQFAKRGVRRRKQQHDEAVELIKEFDIRVQGPESELATLSGGNQQKVVVARELSARRPVMVAAQPTRGIDVGSIEFIHRRLVEQRDSGAAIILISAELDEILQLADRIAVLYRGCIFGPILTAAEATRESVGLLMAGIDQESGHDTEGRSA